MTRWLGDRLVACFSRSLLVLATSLPAFDVTIAVAREHLLRQSAAGVAALFVAVVASAALTDCVCPILFVRFCASDSAYPIFRVRFCLSNFEFCLSDSVCLILSNFSCTFCVSDYVFPILFVGFFLSDSSYPILPIRFFLSDSV